MPKPNIKFGRTILGICATNPLDANVLLAWEVADVSELRCIGEDKNYSGE